MDEMWAGLGATAAARTAEGPTLWMGDMNAHTADRMEGNPDVPAVPARDGCKLNSGAPRPMNIVGRRSLEELGKADLRIVHGRSRFGRSPVWQHTYSGNIRQAAPPKPEVTQAKGRRKSKCVLRSAYSPKTPSSTECVPTFTVIDYMCVNTNMLQHVRDVDVSNEGAELSDHRMLLATLKVKPYTLAVEQVAIAQPDVVRWNLRSLEDPTTKKQFRAAFAAQTVSSVGESEKDQATLVQTIGRALDSVVGTVVVKSPKLGSVSGKANGWMNSPGLKAKLRKKRSLLAKQRKAMESPRATEHSRRQARWAYARACSDVSVAVKGAKRIHFAAVAKQIEASTTTCPKLLWKRLKALAEETQKQRPVYPVSHPVTRVKAFTALAIANAHSDNLSALGAAKAVAAEEDATYPDEGKVARASALFVQRVRELSNGPAARVARDTAAAAALAQGDCPSIGAGHSPHYNEAATRALNVAVTLTEVENALKQCHNGSAPGADAITYEVLKALPVGGQHSITRLYNTVLDTGSVPVAWKTGVVSMLFKKGETDDTANYRGLTLVSTLGKVFERVLLKRLSTHVGGQALMHELQYGFRAARGCEELVFALQQTIEHNPDCCAVFVDVRKAYPTVDRSGLLTKLAQKGITGRVWSCLENWYSGLESKVSVAGITSSPAYPVDTGLMEGAILSPFLYTVLIDGLIRAFEATGVGCKVGSAWTGALYYADDLCLTANSTADMQVLLRVLDQYCRDWQFQPAYAKTKVLYFGKHAKANSQQALYLPSMHGMPGLGGGPGSDTGVISRASEYTYLGVLFTDDATFTKHPGQVRPDMIPASRCCGVCGGYRPFPPP